MVLLVHGVGAVHGGGAAEHPRVAGVQGNVQQSDVSVVIEQVGGGVLVQQSRTSLHKEDNLYFIVYHPQQLK